MSMNPLDKILTGTNEGWKSKMRIWGAYFQNFWQHPIYSVHAVRESSFELKTFQRFIFDGTGSWIRMDITVDTSHSV